MTESSKLPVTVYTPDSELRRPLVLIGRMFHDLRASKELAWRLFVRDTSAMYRQTMFGYFWAFVPPLFAALPFVLLNRTGVFQVGSTGVPYAAYAMIGTVIWQVFVDALNSPLKTVIASKSMLARINFPREAILLAGLYQVLFSFLIRLLMLVAVFAWFRIPPPPTALLLPVGILSLIGLGFMVGLLITPIGVLYNDISQALPFLTTFLMLLTPVVYPPPESGLLAAIAEWNPIAPLVVTTRDWLTTGASPMIGSFLLISGTTLVLILCGWILYRLAMPHLIARIGN